jgi:hypothetical protein
MTDEWTRIRQDLEAQINTQHEGEVLQQELLVQQRKVEAKEEELAQLDRELQ